MGDNKSCKVHGIGSIKLKMNDGSVFTLKNVKYVPEIKRNLISLGNLDQLGYTFKAQEGKLVVVKGSLIVMKGIRSNGLYTLEGETLNGLLNATENNQNDSMLWHLRLAHISNRGLQELYKQGLLGNNPIDQLDFCEDCVKR